MAVVVTFVDYRPPVRYDGNPWTNARIEEATAEDGAYVLLETKTLSPADTNPALPAYRSFTTELGTALDYWYRVVFVDETGDTSQPTTPVQNTAAATAPAVRAYATVDQLAAILNLNPPTAAQAEGMQRVLDAAALEIDWELGLDEPYAQPPALVVQVNLARGVELWKEAWTGFGIVPLGPDVLPVVTARDSWHRHARTLAPLKQLWGVA